MDLVARILLWKLENKPMTKIPSDSATRSKIYTSHTIVDSEILVIAKGKIQFNSKRRVNALWQYGTQQAGQCSFFNYLRSRFRLFKFQKPMKEDLIKTNLELWRTVTKVARQILFIQYQVNGTFIPIKHRQRRDSPYKTDKANQVNLSANNYDQPIRRRKQSPSSFALRHIAHVQKREWK